MNLPFLHLRKDHKKKEMLRRKKEQRVKMEKPGSRHYTWLRRMADKESRSASEHILTVGRAVSQNSPNSLKSTCWSYWVVTLHVVAQEQWARKGVSFPLSVGLVRGAILESTCLTLSAGNTLWDLAHTVLHTSLVSSQKQKETLDLNVKHLNAFSKQQVQE